MAAISRVRPGRVLRYAFNLAALVKSLWRFRLLHPHNIRGFRSWINHGFQVPAPPEIKWRTLQRWGLPGIWVETGTHIGSTTRFLSSISTHTFSIEPDPTLATNALEKFRKDPKVTIIQGLSEVALPELLKSLEINPKRSISFWLDGHYSEGLSEFRGPLDTPIVQELEAIAQHLHDFDEVSILIDDMRCFNPELVDFATYPPKSFLVEWATAHKLFWTIEHDIFIATNRALVPSLP